MRGLSVSLIFLGHMVLCYAHNGDPVVLTGYLLVLCGDLARCKAGSTTTLSKVEKPST